MGKILNINDLKELKNISGKIVLTNGVFDLFHTGHLYCLEESKKFGDILIVGINSDSSVKKIKGESRPIISEINRGRVVAALEIVDYVIIFDDENAAGLIKKIEPDVYVKGNDYENIETPESKLVLGYGGELRFVDKSKINISTTEILEDLK